MSDVNLLGPWLKRFLLEHIQGDRDMSLHTQKSYRDTFAQLIPFLAAGCKRKPEALLLAELSRDSLRLFLNHIETNRRCSVATRNQRLAAIHSLARYVASVNPVHLSWSTDVCAVPFKRSARPLVPYLEKEEIDAMLDEPERDSAQGRRENALLLFLYNSGARADEAAQLRISQLYLPSGKQEQSRVTIRGKGKKIRQCPLWQKTAATLRPLIEGRPPEDHVFLNRRREPLTRFGVYAIVESRAAMASHRVSSLKTKRVSPHVIRHTTATHLLRAGVDINTIRASFGHVSIATTSAGLMAFLRSL